MDDEVDYLNAYDFFQEEGESYADYKTNIDNDYDLYEVIKRVAVSVNEDTVEDIERINLALAISDGYENWVQEGLVEDRRRNG